jgi:glycosyltransferase involved in cell wall biosynthesis
MRIAFFADNFYPELSGISESTILIGSELARRGHRIEYFVPRYAKKNYKTAGVSENELELGENIKINRMASFSFKAPTMQGRAVLPNIFRGFFSKKNFDIIHSQGFFGPGLDALCFSKIKKIPLVGTNHTLFESFIDYIPFKNRRLGEFILKYITWYYGKCNLVATPSNFLLRDMEKKKLKAPAISVSNPIAGNFFTPRKEKNELKKDLGFSKFCVLYVGRISPEKNVNILIKAFIPFAEKNPEASLIIVGQGIKREALEIMARESSVSAQIKFLGPFIGENRKKLFDIYHASDLFVMPSTSETQSMVTLEAMAAGMPIALARAGALPELALGHDNILFAPDNPRELEKIIEYFYAHPEIRQEMGQEAKNFVKKFTVEAMADQWEKIYQNAIKNYARK